MTKPTACLRVTWRRSRESSRQSIGLKNDHWDCCRRSKSCHRQRWTVALALLCRHEVFQTDDNRQCGRNGTAHMVNFEGPLPDRQNIVLSRNGQIEVPKTVRVMKEI